MKAYKKIIVLAVTVILTSNTINISAEDLSSTEFSNNIQSKESITDTEETEQSTKEYYDLETTDVDDIDTNCKNIDIQTTDEVALDNTIEEVGKNDYNDSDLSDVGGADVTTEIVVGNIALPLYPTYNNPERALEDVKASCADILELLKDAYGLDDFSDANWNDYYNSMYEYLDDPNKVEWYDEFNDQFVELSGFFDIYENSDVNNELVSDAANMDSISELSSDSAFLCNLPYFDTDDLIDAGTIESTQNGGYTETAYTKKQFSITDLVAIYPDQLTDFFSTNPYKAKTLSYSSSSAITYAKSYATSYNPNFAQYTGGDCANFASQILLAGGKSYTAKWITACALGKWVSTKAWSVANNFANYWGVDYTYSSHKNFANQLKKGDFITEDKKGDGSWDHIGFVVATKSSYDSSLGYKNYKVAQHTTNYLRWASSSKNGWDKLKTKYPKTIYGIIRIS